jgi:phage protein D
VADLASPSELQAEGKLRIAGIRDPVDGEWVINRVEHQLDSSGLQTRCDAEVPNNCKDRVAITD